MASNGPALVRLKSGYLYAASEHEFRDGHLHITGRRFTRSGPNNERVRFWGAVGARSWPRQEVREVSPVRSLDEAQAPTQRAA